MLATFSTYIARAKRGKQPLCVVGIEQFETALAVLRVAQHQKTPVGFLVSNTMIVRAIASAANTAEEAVVIIARCTTPESVFAALTIGVGAVSIPVDPKNLDEQDLFIKTVVQTAAAHNTSCLAEWPITREIPEKLLQLGVQGILITVPENTPASTIRQRGKEAIQLSLPTLIQIDSLPASMVRQFKTQGFTGYVISVMAEESYTSGLRTALRNRAMTHPKEYLPYGIKAAEEAVTNLIKVYTK